MQRRATPPGQIVRPDRAIGLVLHLGPPHHEPALCLGQPVQALMQGALSEEDHAVGPAGIQGRRQVIVTGWREMAHDHVAAALTRRFADAGQKLKKEGVAQPTLAALGPGRHQGDYAVGTDRSGRHVPTKRIVMLSRQLPDQLLRARVDRRAVVQRARCGRYRHARQPGQIFKTGVASAQAWAPVDTVSANFAANLACSAPLRLRLASAMPGSAPRC